MVLSIDYISDIDSLKTVNETLLAVEVEKM